MARNYSPMYLHKFSSNVWYFLVWNIIYRHCMYVNWQINLPGIITDDKIIRLAKRTTFAFILPYARERVSSALPGVDRAVTSKGWSKHEIMIQIHWTAEHSISNWCEFGQVASTSPLINVIVWMINYFIYCCVYGEPDKTFTDPYFSFCSLFKILYSS